MGSRDKSRGQVWRRLPTWWIEAPSKPQPDDDMTLAKNIPPSRSFALLRLACPALAALLFADAALAQETDTMSNSWGFALSAIDRVGDPLAAVRTLK